MLLCIPLSLTKMLKGIGDDIFHVDNNCLTAVIYLGLIYLSTIQGHKCPLDVLNKTRPVPRLLPFCGGDQKDHNVFTWDPSVKPGVRQGLILSGEVVRRGWGAYCIAGILGLYREFEKSNIYRTFLTRTNGTFSRVCTEILLLTCLISKWHSLRKPVKL